MLTTWLRTVRIASEDERFVGQVLEPVGPDTIDLKDLLLRYRAWLGFGRATALPVPMPLMRLLGRIGDILGNGPVSTNSLEQMVAGNEGDSAAFASDRFRMPRSLDNGAAQIIRPRCRTAGMPGCISSRLRLPRCSRCCGSHQDSSGSLRDRIDQCLCRGGRFIRGAGRSIAYRHVTARLCDRRGSPSRQARGLVYRCAGRHGSGLHYRAGICVAAPAVRSARPLLKNLPILLLILVHGAIGDRR